MILVRIDRIKGDVKIPGYENQWFIADSMSFGVGRDVGAKGRKSQDVEIGKAEIQALEIEKWVDSATVYLMHASMQARSKSGGQAVSIDIHLVHTRQYDDADQKSKAVKPFLKVRIENAIIKEWSIDASGDERPRESLSVWFNRAAMKFRATTDGKVFQTYGPLGWDQYENKDWKSDELLKNED
ncbi:MAG: type VI secretion system tube protein Hcp [Pirellulaceae bacterium]|nr:type VI secretion system tube protein Hcp [Pirellulaceae bacterium]